ncbi:MAG TPA: N-acetyl-gamma-glutamyl-phosphate reductase, partial [Deinococcales bacterium]|nr:N-acetyl-gamma-glutamyl-phosphate reductase [Deinococcales bacterium]
MNAKVAVIGANGYGGGEVARLLAAHPAAEVVAYSSRQFEGQPFTAAWPGAADERAFTTMEGAVEAADTVILALPNGVAMTAVP